MEQFICSDCGAIDHREGKRKTRCAACQKKENYKRQVACLANPHSNSYRPKSEEILSHMEDSDYACTLQEVAIELGVSKERVRQIEYTAIAKLRKYKHLFF